MSFWPQNRTNEQITRLHVVWCNYNYMLMCIFSHLVNMNCGVRIGNTSRRKREGDNTSRRKREEERGGERKGEGEEGGGGGGRGGVGNDGRVIIPVPRQGRGKDLPRRPFPPTYHEPIVEPREPKRQIKQAGQRPNI